VIRKAWRRTVRFLGSAGLATWLLAILALWSVLASIVPQGSASTKEVADWAASHAAIEPLVRATGLHQAFSNPLFIALVVLLGISTSICAWDRTKVAARRSRTLRDAALGDSVALVENHDFEITCSGALSPSDALSIAQKTLNPLGVRTKARDGMIVGVSPRWTVWGSPVFHWALLGLLVVLLLGNMLRAEGLMGVAVGETKPDLPASYGKVSAGPLFDWRRVQRSIRVDAFEANFATGGVNRGPTPTVSLLDGTGRVIKTQRVYPNMMLKSGSITIYPSSFGLATVTSIVTTNGAVIGRGTQLVDFSAEASGGTAPAGYVDMLDASGTPIYAAKLSVPLDRAGNQLVNQLPQDPSARVVVISRDGRVVEDRLIRPGETLSAPGSLGLRLDGITYYARLKIVDDWTIPLLYLGLFVALAGLSVATLVRQQIVFATAIDGPDGLRLIAKVRLWRNASTSRSEIESELARALGRVENGSTP
jgi:cytochrome c biogenesis protein ResB